MGKVPVGWDEMMGWPHSSFLAASGGIRGCAQRQTDPVGRLPSGHYFLCGMKWCPLALPAVKALPMEGQAGSAEAC